MNIELWREVDLMVKYKAEKDHWHGATWGFIIFLFLSVCSLEYSRIDLQARVAYLEQLQGIK